MIADRIGDLYAGLAWEYDNHGNKIRETFDFRGTSLKFIIRERTENDDN